MRAILDPQTENQMTQDDTPIVLEDDSESKRIRQRRSAPLIMLLAPFLGLNTLYILLEFLFPNFMGTYGYLILIPLLLSVLMAVSGVVLCYTVWASSRNRWVNILAWSDIVSFVIDCVIFIFILILVVLATLPLYK
jgi:hypothetical protein